MRSSGTCTIPGANRTGVPLPTKPVGRPEDDIVARLERAHTRPSSSPFTADAPEFTREQLLTAGFVIKADGRHRADRQRDKKIRQLYIDDVMSVREVAAAVAMSTAGVRGAMARLGITPRAQGRNGKPAAPAKSPKTATKTSTTPKPMGRRQTVHIDKAKLTEIYVDRAMSCRATAEELGVATTTVRRALTTYGIPIRHDQAALMKGVTKDLADLLTANGITTSDVRTWARNNGRTVASHGSVGRELIEAYLLENTHRTQKEISA